MILKQLRVQQALGNLLSDLEIIAAEDTGSDVDRYYRDLYWQAQIYSFLDVDIWLGITSETIIRKKIFQKINSLRQNIDHLYYIEKNKEKRTLLLKILKNIDAFDVKNGALTEVIKHILDLNKNGN